MSKLFNFYDSFVELDLDQGTRSWFGIVTTIVFVPIIILAITVLNIFTYSTTPSSNVTTYEPLLPQTQLSIPITCLTLDGCVVESRFSAGDVFTSLDYNEQANIIVNVFDPSIAAAIVWPRRIQFQSTPTLQSCTNDTIASQNPSACGFDPLSCNQVTMIIGGQSSANDSFSVSGAFSGSQTLIASIVIDGSKAATSSFTALSNSVASSADFLPYQATGAQCTPLVADYTTCCYVANDNVFLPQLLAAFNVNNTQGYTKYNLYNPIGYIKLSNNAFKTVIQYYTPFNAVLTVIGSIAGVFSGVMGVFAVAVLQLRTFYPQYTVRGVVEKPKKEEAEKAEPAPKVPLKQTLTDVNTYLDLFLLTGKDQSTRSWLGILSTFVLYPSLLGGYAGLQFYNLSTSPKTNVTSYWPITVGMNINIPITCLTSSGCVVQTRVANSTDTLTPINFGATKTVTAHVYDITRAVALVWPKRVSFQSTVDTRTSCVNETYSATMGSLCTGSFRTSACLINTILIGGVANSSDAFAIQGGYQGSQTLMAGTVINGAVQSDFSVSGLTNSVQTSEQYLPYTSVGANCDSGLDGTGFESCCYTANDTFLPKIYEAFGISTQSSLTKYNMVNSLGHIVISSTYFETVVSYNTPFKVFISASGAIGGVYAVLNSFFSVFVPYINRIAKGKSENIDETPLIDGEELTTKDLNLIGAKKDMERYVDVFVFVKIDQGSKSWYGVVASMVCVPGLLIAYAVITFQQYAVTPMSDVTTYVPLVQGMSFSLPITCGSSSGCVVEYRNKTAEIFQTINPSQTSLVSITVNDPTSSIAVVWPNRLSFQTQVDSSSCLNNTLGLSNSTCQAYQGYIPYCLTKTILVGGTPQDDDSFQIQGFYSGSQTIVATIFYDGSTTPTSTSLKGLSNSINEPYVATSAIGTNCNINNAQFNDPSSCCSVTNDTLLPQLISAFKGPTTYTQSKYSFSNPIGYIQFASSYYKRTITYYNMLQLVAEVGGSVGGFYGALQGTFFIIVHLFRLLLPQYTGQKPRKNSNNGSAPPVHAKFSTIRSKIATESSAMSPNN